METSDLYGHLVEGRSAEVAKGLDRSNRGRTVSESGPHLIYIEAGFVDAEAEAEEAPRISNWLAFMKKRDVPPSDADKVAGDQLPDGDYLWDGEGWRQIELLALQDDQETERLDLCENYPTEPYEPYGLRADMVGRSFVVDLPSGHVVIATPVEMPAESRGARSQGSHFPVVSRACVPGPHIHISSQGTYVMVKPCVGPNSDLGLGTIATLDQVVPPPLRIRRILFRATLEKDIRSRIARWQRYLAREEAAGRLPNESDAAVAAVLQKPQK